MTDKPQQPKHDDRVEGRPEPRATAASFDNGLTLPSSNETLKRKMQLPSNEEAVESTPHLQLAVAPEPAAAAVAPVADNKVVAPFTAPASLSRVSATGDFNADTTAAVGTTIIKPGFTSAALPGADGQEPGKFSAVEPAKFSTIEPVNATVTEKPGTKTFNATAEVTGKVFTATDSGGFFNKFMELGTKHPIKSMDEGVVVSDKGGRSATAIGKVVTMAVDDIIAGTKRVKVADDGHPDRKPVKDRDAGGFFARLFEADKPRKRRDDDDNNGNGRKRKKDDDDGQHPPRKRRDDDGDGPPRKRKPDDDAPPKKPKGNDNNGNGKKHKEDVPGPKHADVPPPKLPPSAPPGDGHGVKPAGNGRGGRPGGGGGADGQGDDSHGGGGGRGRHSSGLRDFQNNLDRLSGLGSSGKGGRDHVASEPSDRHAAAAKATGGAVGRGLPTLGAPAHHGDAKGSVVPASAQRGTEHTRGGAEHGTGHGGKHLPVESKTQPVRPERRTDNHHGDGTRNAGGHGRPGPDAHGGGELRTRHGIDAHKIAQLPDLRAILRPEHRGQKTEAAAANHGGERTGQSDAVHRGGMPHQAGRAGLETSGAAHDGGAHREQARLDILENTRRNLDPRQEQIGGRRNGEAGEFAVRANGNERGGARGPAAENNTGRTHSGERATESANKTERNNDGSEAIPGDRNAAGRAHTAPTTSAEEEEARKKNRRLLQQDEDATQFVPEETRTPGEEELPGTIHVQHAFVPTDRSQEEEEGTEEELESALTQDEQRQRQLAILAATNNDPSQPQSQQQQNQQGSNAGANGGGTVVDPDAVLPSVEIVGTAGLHHSGHHAHLVPDQQTTGVPHRSESAPVPQVAPPDNWAHQPDAPHQPDAAHVQYVAHSPASGHQPSATETGADPRTYADGSSIFANYGAAAAGAAINGTNGDDASSPPPLDLPPTQSHVPPLAAQDVAAIVADSSQYVESVTEELPAFQQEDWHVVGAFDVEQRREVELSAYEDHAAAMKAMRDAEMDAYDLREKQQREERERLEAERNERERREAEREDRERRDEEARVRRQRELDEYQRKLILLSNKGGEYPDMPRVKYVVQTGDTLESIAVRRFRDKRIAQLIFHLNKRTIPARLSGNKTFLTLTPGTPLSLPNHQDIKSFYSLKQAPAVFGYEIADVPPATQSEAVASAADGGNRRANIEKLLGTVGSATTKPESTCVVRLGDSLHSLAKRVLKDPTLWLLLAETNGLSCDCDDSGQSTIRLQRGTILVLPTNEQITEFNRRLQEAAATTLTDATTATDADVTVIDATTFDSSATRVSAAELTAIARDIADVCREYVFLREGVRLAVCLNKTTGTEMNIALEIDIDGQWTVAYSYEQRCADKWYRNKFDAQGRVTRLPLELPDRIAIELAQNDLYCDWETYADEFLDSMRFSLRA